LENSQGLRPTPEQYQAFGDYLRAAHSWYKHLPLMQGRRFVVFVALDAGVGRLVAKLHGASPETATGCTLVTPPEGPEFTDEHPRLHYGWKTTKEYRSRFGYLDYMCRRGPNEPYDRDVGPPISLPSEVEERCGFVLYPYASGMFAEAVLWTIHEEAIEQLQAGANHPAREQVLELARLAREHRTAWSVLGDADREWLLSRERADREEVAKEASADLRKYLDLDAGVRAVCGSLRTQETAKIRRALEELDDWLQQGK